MWLKQDRGLVKVVMKWVYGSGWDRDDLSTKARSGWCWNRLISGQVNVLMTQANGRYCQADPAKDKGQCKVKIAQINDDWCVATWLVGGFVHMQKKVVCTMSHLIQVWPLNLTSFDLLWCVCVCVCVWCSLYLLVYCLWMNLLLLFYSQSLFFSFLLSVLSSGSLLCAWKVFHYYYYYYYYFNKGREMRQWQAICNLCGGNDRVSDWVRFRSVISAELYRIQFFPISCWVRVEQTVSFEWAG